jgi:hypothetical protein
METTYRSLLGSKALWVGEIPKVQLFATSCFGFGYLSTLKMDMTSFRNVTIFPELCKILGFHGGDYAEWSLLGCYAGGSLRTDVSEELSASFNRVTRIDELGTTLAVTSNRRTLRRNAKFLRNVDSYKNHTA